MAFKWIFGNGLRLLGLEPHPEAISDSVGEGEVRNGEISVEDVTIREARAPQRVEVSRLHGAGFSGQLLGVLEKTALSLREPCASEVSAELIGQVRFMAAAGESR